MIELQVSVDNVSKRIALQPGKTVFGRNQAADVILDGDRMISSRHFEIELADNGCLSLTDLGSTNGTRVNGQETRKSSLQAGDEIQVGVTTLIVLPSASGGEQAVTSAEKLAEQTLESAAADAMVDRLQQVCLRVVSERDQGKVFWFGAGTGLVIGRTAKADCIFAEDGFMSGQHCRLSCTETSCHVEDLQSRSGTWLNGASIKQAEVFDGDCIRVGSTELVAELLSAGGQRVAAPTERPLVATSSAPAPSSVTANAIMAVRRQLATGQLLLTGQLDALTPSELVERLAAFGNGYLIMDFSRVDQPIAKEFDVAQSTLFPWLPAEAFRELPVLIALDELPRWKGAVEAGWANDAVVFLVSTGNKQELIEALRELIKGSGPVDSIVGLCWPSVLRPMIASRAEELPQQLLAHSNLVCYVGQDPTTWQLLIGADRLPEFEKRGVQTHEATES